MNITVPHANFRGNADSEEKREIFMRQRETAKDDERTFSIDRVEIWRRWIARGDPSERREIGSERCRWRGRVRDQRRRRCRGARGVRRRPASSEGASSRFGKAPIALLRHLPWWRSVVVVFSRSPETELNVKERERERERECVNSNTWELEQPGNETGRTYGSGHLLACLVRLTGIISW